jgi:hypothetical protein
MNAWDNLPNAKHIDFIIESVKKYPDEWVAARDATYDAAYNAAWGAAWGETWDAVRSAALGAAGNSSWYALRSAAWGSVSDAILSLVAYDDCEQYLDMSYNELLFMAKLTELPATVLLLPYVKAMELIKEKQIK